MTSLQKVIKYLAIAFAIFLIVTIISSILAGVYALSSLLGLRNNNKELPKEMTLTSYENTDIQELDIEIEYTNLTIKTSDYFKIETSNKEIATRQDNKTLEIKEKGYKWFSNGENEELIIYIPENLEFEKVKINAGAGEINIENLFAQKLSFELGAGKTEIHNINISRECEIEGGAGQINILSGTIKNLDLDMGIGETNIYSNLLGQNEINAGIGNLNIELVGDKENYEIKANKGLGTIKVDGRDLVDGENYGDGENTIKVDGGIGNINIKFDN